MLGVATRLAAISGAIWMGISYLATAIEPGFDPLVDEHIVHVLVLVGPASTGADRSLGPQERWERLALVKRSTFLR